MLVDPTRTGYRVVWDVVSYRVSLEVFHEWCYFDDLEIYYCGGQYESTPTA